MDGSEKMTFSNMLIRIEDTFRSLKSELALRADSFSLSNQIDKIFI